jgi:hypothetical protein
MKSEATRIDYFLVWTEILMNSYSSDIRPIVLKFTDHNSISLKLKLFKGNKGYGYWKLNTSILENQEYCKSIEKLITKYQHKFKEQTKLDILWDNFKLESCCFRFIFPVPGKLCFSFVLIFCLHISISLCDFIMLTHLKLPHYYLGQYVVL